MSDSSNPASAYQLSLLRGLKRLRRGLGLQLVREDQIDSAVKIACSINASDDYDTAQKKLLSTVKVALARLPEQSRLVTEVQFGIHSEARYRTLTERALWLEEKLGNSERTTVRRMNEALSMLATAIIQNKEEGLPGRPDGDVYYIESFKALLSLAGETATALEERTIVAITDNLSEFETSISVPKNPDSKNEKHGLEMQMLHGGRIELREQPYESFFRQVVALASPLKSGQKHTYLLSVSLPEGQLLSPHYVHVPFRRSDHFELRVQFDPTRVPEQIWVLNGVPTAVIYEQQPNCPTIQPDKYGELLVRFENLKNGFGYGVCWK